jgi:two-component system CheB/CheR fusion protein
MYFNAEMQKRVLERLRFALNPRGVLFLGKAEMLLTQSDLFTPIDLKRRLFMRANRGGTRTRDKVPLDPLPLSREPMDEARLRLQQAAFDCARIAQIAIDADGNVGLLNKRASQLFGLSSGATLGQPFRDLDVSYRPVELRSCIEKVRIDRRPVELKGIERIGPTGEKTFLDVEVIALISAGVFAGTLINFTDATQIHQLQTDLRRTTEELEAAHQELQATSEELETTNEELQSTVEELETTNEELQTINVELRQRGKEVNEVNAFHGNVLASLHVGVAVLDEDLAVRTWNAKMEDMWGARADEVVGYRFADLDIGLPVGELRGAARAALTSAEESETTIECTNRRGKKVSCCVSVVPLRRVEHRGVVVVVEEVKA